MLRSVPYTHERKFINFSKVASCMRLKTITISLLDLNFVSECTKIIYN